MQKLFSSEKGFVLTMAGAAIGLGKGFYIGGNALFPPGGIMQSNILSAIFLNPYNANSNTNFTFKTRIKLFCSNY